MTSEPRGQVDVVDLIFVILSWGPFECPVDEENTSLFLVNLRNFLIDPEDDARMMERNAVVAMQDRDVLLDIEPVLTPETRTRELFTPTDGPIGAYRETCRGLANQSPDHRQSAQRQSNEQAVHHPAMIQHGILQ